MQHVIGDHARLLALVRTAGIKVTHEFREIRGGHLDPDAMADAEFDGGRDRRRMEGDCLAGAIITVVTGLICPNTSIGGIHNPPRHVNRFNIELHIKPLKKHKVIKFLTNYNPKENIAIIKTLNTI